ncbi:NAD-dependent succinate-semialdehyde dehydrogenase [Flexithrix dorotheae]|uniref:NAD-dependent succinate-semialdehyde dehydrogenase n=1 Tax=Flexithrix dorotheae TaxID=70993 RepID=UPI000362C2E0|nr:NAD-dependent succinate-semialdehyde dehydrogenase [Flexithrix dorotheae]
MTYKSINPYNGEILNQYAELSEKETASKLARSGTAFEKWRAVPLEERARLMKNAGNVLRNNEGKYAKMITLEMGKPIKESKGEVNKCAWVCDYYAENAADFLKDEFIETDAQKSFVKHEPLGCILAVMPWNFPFWQVFRFAAPTLTAGNTAILKHASNVYGCAILIEEVFTEAGFPEGVFQNLIVGHGQIENILSHDAVKAVSLTGSEKAGASVAAIAGKNLKKSLLELGGSNAFIVWDDADIEKTVKTALTARMLNCGQSCIAAKRFILADSIHDEFVSRFTEAVKKLKSGNPLEETTEVGPLARKDLAENLQKQVQDSIKMGAELVWGGQQNKCFHEPTILKHVTPEMPAFKEETFGPLAAMIRAKDVEDAFRLSELSPFGLGVTVCTTNIEKAIAMSSKVSDGAYFINELVKSDPRLPFGGTKISGYGRELSKDGILEFVNRKTVYVK